MIVPSKFTSFDKSILARLPCLLRQLTNEKSISQLYAETHREFEDVGEFVLALDTLFVLGRIAIDEDLEYIIPC